MISLASEMKQVLARRIQTAPASEILTIMSNLCAAEILPALEPIRFDVQERFMLIDDVMVADRSTGLTWSRANVPGGRMNWKKAAEACAALELGGQKDWRLPTVPELLSLVDYDRCDPAIDPVFTCDASYYWTSKAPKSSPHDVAWIVFFDDGNSGWNLQGSEYFARAVRSSQ